jgi:hypothetical protein
MPRRPVKPQDRQRVVRACDPCKTSKKRCNGCQPCSACKDKGCNASCHYTAGRRHHPLPRHSLASAPRPQLGQARLVSDINTTSEVLISPKSLWSNHNPPATSLGSIGIGTSYADTFGQHRSEDDLDNDSRGSSNEDIGQPPVLLSSVSGEKGQF